MKFRSPSTADADAVFFGGVALCIVAAALFFIAAEAPTPGTLGLANVGMGLLGVGVMAVVWSVGRG